MKARQQLFILVLLLVVAAGALVALRVSAGRFLWHAPVQPTPAVGPEVAVLHTAIAQTQAAPAASQPASQPASAPIAPSPAGNGLWSRTAGPAVEQIAAAVRPATGAASVVQSRLQQSATWVRRQAATDLDAGRLSDADAKFLHAARLSPRDPASFVGLGLVASKRNDFDAAARHFRWAIRLDEWNVDALYNLGVLYNRQRELHDAEQMYRRVLTTQPDHLRAKYNLAAIATYYGRLTESRELWEEVVAAQPSLTEARYNLGLIYLQLKRHEDAIRQFATVRERQPKDADVCNNLGLCYQAKGDWDNASKCFAQAYELKPDDVVVLNNLADFHLAMHNNQPGDTEHLAAAVKLWDRSMKLNPTQERVASLLVYFRKQVATQPAN